MEIYLEYLSSLGNYHYLGLFGLLILCGLGLPVPEDIIIIAGGYMAYLGDTQLLPTIITLYFGAICGDSIPYWFGRKYGPDIVNHRRLSWVFTPDRIKAINHYFHKYGNATLFFARFMVGLRTPIFLSAGAFKISYRRMLFSDGAAALISIPLITLLAHHFGDQIDHFSTWVRHVEHAIFVVIALVALTLFLKFISFLRKKNPEYSKESTELTLQPDETGHSK